ncbi:hydrogenase maturation protease [Clostridium vincentii]|uniref:Hydrogenase 3 maturation protease n=1 Tax=Clostridium vincentii TaxID=52704 RepID=A0A2T0BCB8_9CLOT|nr:hydrogenase maturation protease [Clostridium vincentii]PRR81528.1 hydrogenase 3 maturation protease [Clostridium vincentii]
MIKVIGIGNSLMGDDSIALKVIDSIEREIEKLNLEIKCLKAETDFNFALDNIEDGDYLFILDSTILGLDCGQVTQIHLEDVDKYPNNSLSIHNMNLLSLINHFKININGFVIGIEAAEVKFSLEISKELKVRFEEICQEIYIIIKEKSLEYRQKCDSSA